MGFSYIQKRKYTVMSSVVPQLSPIAHLRMQMRWILVSYCQKFLFVRLIFYSIYLLFPPWPFSAQKLQTSSTFAMDSYRWPTEIVERFGFSFPTLSNCCQRSVETGKYKYKFHDQHDARDNEREHIDCRKEPRVCANIQEPLWTIKKSMRCTQNQCKVAEVGLYKPKLSPVDTVADRG